MILNLTQHQATPVQRAAGVVDVKPEDIEALRTTLTFDEIPDTDEIGVRATLLAQMAARYGHPHVMIGGALWLMAPLITALRNRKLTPMFAFSKRVVREETDTNGTVTKTVTFIHEGFIEGRTR